MNATMSTYSRKTFLSGACLAFAAAFLLTAAAGAGEAPQINLASLFGGGASQEGPTKTRLDAETLRGLLSKERNILVEEQGEMLVVDGRVSSKSAQIRLQKILERYDNILDLTEFIQDEEAIIARADYLKQKIEERLNRNYSTEKAFVPKQQVVYDIVANEVVIVGELNNNEDVKQVAKIIDTYEKTVSSDGAPTQGASGPDGVSASADHLSVSKQPLEIDLIFAKITKNDQLDLGLGGLITGTVNIPDLSYSADDGSGNVGPGHNNPFRMFKNHQWRAGGLNATFDPVNLSINELESANRILSRPHLSTLNGTPARFHAGGQVGIRLPGTESSSVEWKDYGTILTATPTLTTDGRVHLKITLEITAATTPVTGGSDVGFTRFEHESEAIVSANQGMVLSGIIRSMRERAGDGIPGLRKLPILGYFFGNKRRAGDSEELVVIAIPRFSQVINNPLVDHSEYTTRLVNGVVHEIRGGRDRQRDKSRALDSCATSCSYGHPDHIPAIRVDVEVPMVTAGDFVAPSPTARNFSPPSFAPQEMDFTDDLVTF